MAEIVYGTGAYRRDNGNLPELKLKNMFLESAVTSEGGVILMSRQGLSSYLTPGSGPVTGVFVEDGVFSGDVFSVSDGTLYRNITSIGTITGTGPVSFASGLSTELLICAGASIHLYDGVTLTTVTFPDDADVSSIKFHDGLYLAAVSDSDKWYWSDPLDGSSWDALNFATAESQPDVLRDLKIVGDYLYLIGSSTIERWANTGDSTAPYSRVEGSIVPIGAKVTGCSVSIEEAHGAEDVLFFVGNNNVVYMMTSAPTRISDNGIEERIKDSTAVSAFGFTHEGHTFYALRLDTGTFLYDLTTQQWCEFATYGRSNWRAQCACMSGGVTLFGDDEDGILWTFSGWVDGSVNLERLFTAVFPLHGGTVSVNNLTIEANTGHTVDITNPAIAEIRASRSSGITWGTWRQTSMGYQGAYRVKTQWRRLGMFDFPGAMFEIRTTDPVPFRISSVLINEDNGGRSR